MALTALEIYKHLPKTNCGKCGFPTCLAFAMQLSQKKIALDKCPEVTEQGRAALEGASAPPIRLVTVGAGERRLQVGNETVLFRHEQTFYHPTGFAVTVSDALSDTDLGARLEELRGLTIERVGVQMALDLIAVRSDSGNAARFAEVVGRVARETPYPLMLMSRDPAMITAALAVCAANKPLIYAADAANWQAMSALAKGAACPLAVVAPDIAALAELTPQVAAAGVPDLVIGVDGAGFAGTLQSLTAMRRLALKKTFRVLGYPPIVVVTEQDPIVALNQAATYTAKYAGIVVMEHASRAQLLSVLTMRYNLYTDPQKPIQVKPGVYAVRDPGPDAPVLLTTNFSLTYYTVQGDVDASRIPAYIVVIDTEGTSVMTSWAADKLNAEKVAAALADGEGVAAKVNHRRIIIPGLVAVMAAKLKEKSGWEVLVGPRESAGIPRFLKSM